MYSFFFVDARIKPLETVMRASDDMIAARLRTRCATALILISTKPKRD